VSLPADIQGLLAKAKAITIKPRAPFLGLAVAAIAGVYAADHWKCDSRWLLGGTVGTALVAFLVRRTWLCLACCFVAFAALHSIRHAESPGRALEAAVDESPRVAELTGIVWSDPEPLSYSRGKPGGTFKLKLERVEIGGVSSECSALIAVTWTGPLPTYGDEVVVAGALKPLAAARNPGQFDYSDFLRRQGIFARLETKFIEDCRIIGHERGNAAVALALNTRRWMQAQLARDLEDSPDQVALISSMVLGMRGETPDDVQDLFRQTGTLHLFAVSGLNIAMLGVIAAFLLRPFGLNHRLVAFLIIPILVFYALITGLSASCVRAAIMGALVLFALVAERKSSVYNSLCAAAVLILAWDTNQLFAPGFQFSFVLVLVIVACATRIQKRIQPWGMPDPFLPRPLWNWRQHCRAFLAKWLAASLGVTVASWFGSLAFTAGYFHMFSPSAVVANMVAVPIAFLVLALGLATLLAAPFSSALASLFTNANWCCANALLSSVKFFALLPGSHVYVELPRFERPPALELTALDVGDGAAIHVRNRGGDWLVDGGPAWRYSNVTLPYLRSRGVNRLTGLLLSHGDAQHLGAATSIVADFEPRTVFDSSVKDRSSTRSKLHAELRSRNQGKSFLQRGDSLMLGDAKVGVLFPPAGLARNASDDKALVLMLECEGRRVLLMSDSGFPTEQWLIESGSDLKADVLIKGQHGKDLSGTGEFLDRVQPLAIVASADDSRRSADAFDAWTDALKAHDIVLFRQDQCGAVTVQTRDGELRISGFVNGQAFLNRAR
jgi:ComEC/Rec2-related protein